MPFCNFKLLLTAAWAVNVCFKAKGIIYLNFLKVREI